MRRGAEERFDDLDRGGERPGLTVEADIHFGRGRHGRRLLQRGKAEPAPVLTERVPRIARTMAMAIEMQRLVDEGVVRGYAELAQVAGLTRARVSQVMALAGLAPDLMETVLCGNTSEVASSERELRRIAAVPRWSEQRRASAHP